ncbi:MAG: prolipoprotein diacylglyceryl transferase [Acidimicrobiales bacterium]
MLVSPVITAVAASGPSVVGSIPSPSSNQLEIGPLTLNYYGLCIGLGVLVAVFMGQRRWAARGGHPDDIAYIATWGVPAGLIGARAYHVITDWRPIDSWLKVWEGGLGIPGGLVVGVSVGYWAAKRRGLDVGNVIDAIVPGIPVAQAIGRFGNWFNQEIFGRPTEVPWAVEIDPEHRPAEFADSATFHPAFLYEAIWNLGLAAFLVWIDRTGRLRKGMILPLYIGGYGIGRFVVEAVRIDPATLILGVRVNHWVSGAAVLLAASALLLLFKNAGPSYWAAAPSPGADADGGAADDTAADDTADDDEKADDDDTADDDETADESKVASD